jgi:hypothetical protein
MEKLTLEALHIITWIAAWVGPVVLIWRFRAVGWLCGIFWFWWVSILWSYLDYDLAWANYRVSHQPPPGAVLQLQFDEGPLILIIFGGFYGLIYCSFLVAIIAYIKWVIWDLRQ